MSARRIVVNAEVRALLGELDALFRKFDEQTALLSGPLGDVEAAGIGADREQVRAAIVGCAYRINKASVRGGE